MFTMTSKSFFKQISKWKKRYHLFFNSVMVVLQRSYHKPGLLVRVLEVLPQSKLFIRVTCAKLLLYSIDLHFLNLVKLKI